MVNITMQLISIQIMSNMLYRSGQIEKKRSVFWKVFSDVLYIFISVLKTINVDVQPNVKQELSYLQEIQVKLWY